jgi:hypothetical protein
MKISNSIIVKTTYHTQMCSQVSFPPIKKNKNKKFSKRYLLRGVEQLCFLATFSGVLFVHLREGFNMITVFDFKKYS